MNSEGVASHCKSDQLWNFLTTHVITDVVYLT